MGKPSHGNRVGSAHSSAIRARKSASSWTPCIATCAKFSTLASSWTSLASEVAISPCDQVESALAEAPIGAPTERPGFRRNTTARTGAC